MPVREELLNLIWMGVDPFAGFQARTPDAQGWGSKHPYLAEAIRSIRPKIVVEVGVWKGGSVLTMAKEARSLGLDCVVIGVDTFLGSGEHYTDPQYFPLLGIENGRASLYEVFMSNVIHNNLQGIVLPFPLDSSSAALVLRHFGVWIDVLHIDAAHDYESVTADIERWWPLLRTGGILIGDDYTRDVWPGVVRAFDEFTSRNALPPVEHHSNKCRLTKP